MHLSRGTCLVIRTQFNITIEARGETERNEFGGIKTLIISA